MADVKKTIDIIFNADDKVSQTIKNISNELSGFGTGIEAVAAPFASITDGVLAADAALAAFTIGGMALAIKSASDFDSQFGEIHTLLDVTGDSVSDFKNDILDYATNSTQSLDQINAAVYSAISAGVDYKDALTALNAAEKLSVAGKAELESTMVLLAGTMNAYGASADDAAHYSDIFFQTVKLGQTTIPELSASLSQVTGVAASVGMPLETLAASISTLTSAGQPTAQAITGIKAALSNIIKPSSIAAEEAKKLGIQFDATALESKGFEKVLQEVYKATDGNTKEMAKFFGSVEGLNAALVLAGQGSSKFANDIIKMKDAAGSTDEAYQKLVNTLDNLAQNLKNNVQVAFASVGGKLVDALDAGTITAEFAKIFQAVKQGVDAGAFDPLFDALSGFGDSLFKMLNQISTNLPAALNQLDFSGLVGSFKDLGKTIGSMFDVDFSTADGLADAIQGIIDGISGLINITDGIATAFAPYVDALKEMLTGTTSLGAESQKAIGEFLGVAKAVTAAGVEIAAAILAIQKSGSDIGTVFNGIVGTIKGLFNAFSIEIEGIWFGIADFVKFVLSKLELLTSIPLPGFETINEKIQGAIHHLDLFGDTLKDSISKDHKEMLEGFAQAFGETSKATEEASGNLEKLNQKAQEHTKFTGEIENGYIDMSAALTATDEEWEKMLSAVEKHHESIQDVTSETKKAAEAAADYTVEIDKWGQETINFKDAIKEGEDFQQVLYNTKEGAEAVLLTFKNTVPAIKEGTDAIEKTEKVIKKSEEAAMKMKLAMIDAFTQLSIASIEADVAKFETMFDSINTGLQESTKVLDSIFSNIGNSSFYQIQQQMLELAEKEMEMKNKLIDKQLELIDIEIKMKEQKLEMMENGESLISIDGSGLEPEIEAFMWKILEKIQVRVNEEASEFLLGI